MHGLEAEYWDRVDFVYLDREDPANRAMVQAFGVVYQPELIFITPEGGVLAHWFSLNPNELRSAFDDYLASSG